MKTDNNIKRNGGDQGIGGGLLGTTKDYGFPAELMTAAKNVEEAISRTVIRDDTQLCKLIALHRKLVKFHNTAGLETLLLFINGMPAISGHNRSLATQAYVGMFYPEASGTKLDKRQREALVQMNRDKFQGNNKSVGNQED